MKKAIWIISGLLTIIVSLVYFYFKGSLQISSRSDLSTYVSNRNAFVIDFKYENDLSEILADDSNIPNFFYDTFIDEVKGFDQIIRKNKSLHSALNAQHILVSAQKVNAKTLGCIYLADTYDFEVDDVSILFNSDDELVVKSKARSFENENIYHFEGANQDFYYAYIAPHLLVSKFPTLIEDALRAKVKGQHLSSLPIFQKWQTEQSNGKSLLSVFINHANLQEFYSLFFQLPFQKSLGITNSFAEFSYAEMNYKSDAWILNGEIESSEKKYFSLLKNQTENRSYLCNYLSANTWSFQDLILSDPILFRSDLQKQIQLNQDYYFAAEQKLMTKKYGVNITQLLNEHMGSELIAAYYPNYSLSKHTGFIAMMVLQQPEEFEKKIERLQKNSKSISYNDYQIKTFPIRKMMYLGGGEPFKELDTKYYVLIEDRLILSSDVSDIKRYLDDYKSDLILKNKESFQNYCSQLNDQYNYLYYAGISGYEASFKNLLNTKASGKLMSKKGWSNYSAFAYQVTSSDAGLINSIYLPLIDLSTQSTLEQKWQIKLESSVSTTAQWVVSVNKDKNYIFVQDDTNRVYLIDEESNILWKKIIPEKIISKIHAVDYYKNGVTQLLFNSNHQIYLIDLDGNAMPGYPKKLSSETNVGITVFDYDKNKNYRLFIACTNQSVYGYDLSGRPLDGWNPKRLGSIIDKMQHVRVGNKDYLFVATEQGYFYFLNRKGELQTQFKDSANSHYYNPFYFDESPEFAKNRFVSTDQNGKIKSIFLDGRRLFKSVGTWTDSHYFLFANVVGDAKKDYVFIDNNQLMVFQDDTTVGYNYQFNTTISDQPFVFDYQNGESVLGVISRETEQLYMFNREGVLLNGFPINSSVKPSLLEVNNQKRMIVATKDGKLIYYLL
ncbi:MAG: hypothetical protein K9I48_07275 [Sphingobacteriales bacterium]|nr:hypothetical protein [Sphingobacteriales bacterium]